MFRKGAYIERQIDGVWFSGEVIDIEGDNLTIKYFDDQKIEKDVSTQEVRPLESIFNFVSYEKKETLSKPLLGLIEDDAEDRLRRTPNVIIHEDGCELESAVVIHGSQENLAVGGGLRALRYLKP